MAHGALSFYRIRLAGRWAHAATRGPCLCSGLCLRGLVGRYWSGAIPVARLGGLASG